MRLGIHIVVVSGSDIVNYGLTFAGLSGRVQTDETGFVVNDTTYILPGPGCGPDYALCPDRIPTGTIITPSN
jgi:hypothetical protein